jgi:hypothetical protein
MRRIRYLVAASLDGFIAGLKREHGDLRSAEVAWSGDHATTRECTCQHFDGY